MKWQYQQSTGTLFQDGTALCQGYSGHGEGENNPAMQNVRDVGPCPRGIYTLAGPECTATLALGQVCPACRGIGIHKHGPFVLRLIPDPANEMHGRAGMLCHGDNTNHTASEGCIIMPLWVRKLLAESEDKQLEVIE